MFKFFEDSPPVSNVEVKNNVEVRKCEELHLHSGHFLKDCHVNNLCFGSEGNQIEIKYIPPDKILSDLQQTISTEASLCEAEQQQSDLVSGIYEGGLKIWECTYDLGKFLLKEKVNFVNKRVLDLGCGLGILGMLSFIKGANVVFQDYNIEVLKRATIPNVLLNKNSEKNMPNNDMKVKFFSGDWDYFSDYYSSSTNEKFDFILTSETIYNCDNYKKIHRVFIETLKKNGKIYIAAKSYYFGLGGGVHDFIQFVNAQNIFSVQKCWESETGMKRQIILLNFKNDNRT